MQTLVHNPGILALGILILVLAGALTWHLTHPKPSPGPDTVIRRALSASEVERDALRNGSGATASALVKPKPIVVREQHDIPAVPSPRPVPYARLRESANQRIALEGPLTTELTAVTPAQIEADRNQLLLVAQQATPVSTAPRELLDMSVAEMMDQIIAASQTALIPKLDGAPVLPGLPDRRIHASLPDGSEVVRYDRAGKWFHEGPGLRSRLTLGQAAILASSPGAIVRSGVPGGGLFDLRVRKAREQEQA